jgi:hypothetical protein
VYKISTEGTATPFCDKCGKLVREDALFCRNCGRKFQNIVTSPAQSEPHVSSVKGIAGISAVRSADAQTPVFEKESGTSAGERSQLVTYLVLLATTITPVGAFMLLMLSAVGFSSMALVGYSFGIAAILGILGLVIYANIDRRRRGVQGAG